MVRAFGSAHWPGFALIAVACVALVGLQAYSGWTNGPRLRQGRALVVHTFEVMDAAQGLARAVEDAERGQRGYLITGDPKYLSPYLSGAEQAPRLLARLRQLTADDPSLRQRLAVIDGQLKIKLGELAQTIEVRRAQGFEAARRIVETDEGLNAMREVLGNIEDITAAETELLQARLGRAGDDEQATAIISWVSVVVALAIMGLGFFSLWRSLVSLRVSDAARRQSQEHFRLLVDGVPEYAMYTLDPEGRLTSWNSGAERLKGYREDEVLGRHFSMFFTPEDRQAQVPERALETAVRDGHFEMESWHVRKDGSRFVAGTLIDPLRDADGRLIGFAKITRDITERVRQQETLDRTRAALAQSQKMDALGQLTGGIAHDFNNLLQVIIGSIEALRRRTRDNAELLRFADTAARGAERAASLTQQLLAFTRRQPLNPQAIDANKLVVGMSEMLRRTLGESIAVETVLAAGLWRISADVNQLESAVVNLAVNARDAMAGGGKLTIETANVYLDERYAEANTDVTPGQYVLIAVSDTGVGMSAETAAKAFEPFFTTKDVGKGTGLGLSQVYGFLRQSGGHIKIYSELGSGTTVKMYLPRLTGDAAADEPAKEAGPPASLGRETILLVEDDGEVRKLSSEWLRELGYQVVAAADAGAVRALDGGLAIDLLFTDVGLPGGVNGRQLADEVRRRWPRAKVLFTTGYARNAIIHHGRLDPGVELILKPFTQEALAEKIREVLDVG